MTRLASQLSTIALAAALLLGSLATAHAAQDEHPRQAYEVMRFNEDGTEYLLKVTDPNFGTLYQVRNSADNAVVKAYTFTEDDEKSVMKRIERVHKMSVEPHSDSPHPKDELVALLTGQRGANFYIFATYGASIGVYDKIELVKDLDGKPAQAFGKQIAWTPDGKYVVIIFHQKVDDRTQYAGDFIHAFKFDKKKLPKS